MTNLSRNQRRLHRHQRSRYHFAGTAHTPRLSVFKSRLHFYCQLIDDDHHHTLASANTAQLSPADQRDRKLAVKKVAHKLVHQAQAQAIKQVIFDRSGYVFTGLIKLFADEVCSKGLKF